MRVTAMRHGTPATQDMETDSSHPLACARLVLALLCVSALTLCSPLALALDPSLHISQYAHKSWKVRDGFYKGIIHSIAQSADGYLWLGTDLGLLRFDGVRAVPWDSPPPHLPSSNITALLAARDGTLWIGTYKGLASWKSGILTVYPQFAGLLVNALIEDHEGTIWAGGFAYTPPGKLCGIQHGTIHCYGQDGTLGNGVLGLYEDREKRLWAGALNGFWQWSPGPPKFYPLAGQLNGIQYFTEDDGTLYILFRGQMMRFADGKLVDPVLFPATARQPNGTRVLRDRDGGYWIGTNTQGVVHAYLGNFDTFQPADGLSDDDVAALFEDHEGNIWVATNKGLDRFSSYSVSTYSRNEGLSSDITASVLAASDGGVWFNAENRLSRLDRGQITIYHAPTQPSEQLRQDVQQRLRTIIVSGLPNHDLGSLFQDGDRHIWLAATGGVGYLDDDRFVSIKGVPGGVVYAIGGDKSGNLWISNFDAGLLHLLNGRLVQQIPWTALGRNDLATALAVDPSQGGLWVGFSKGGLAYLSDGRIRTLHTAADGLGQGRVSDLRFDRDGTLWVATDGGLSLVKDGRIVTLTPRDGLPCDRIFWTAEDDLRSVWLYASCGLVRIDRSELDAWTAARTNGTERPIHTVLSDNYDGVVLAGDLASSPGPRSSVSPDGKIWFPVTDGLSVVDPRHLSVNKHPPPVHIEQLTADRKVYWQNLTGNASSSQLRLQPLVRDLTIDYTALSFVVPEKVRFRFKLEGQDGNWREVVNQRQVQYSNLVPGNYRFRVVASNNSGVWNEQGAALDFSIAPAYWQTTWFRAACVAAFLFLLWVLYQLRLRQIRQAFNARLEERVGERTRIARDLHDTLLQNFQGLLLRFQTVLALCETRPVEAKEVLRSSIDQTAQAITEGREAVQGLRASTVESNDLAQAITTLGEQLAAEASSATSAGLHVEVEGTPRNLHPIVRDEIYRVASEALRNAFRHAEAQQIEVEFRYDQRQFRLRVRDDGKGIEATFLTAEGRAGHFGLHGMRERAKLMGGKLTVWTAAQSGTEIELILPAARAYAGSPRRSWLAEKFSRKSVRSKS
jgi:signal transduction histidine kinase/ligand-binding sensor domain-containing protein